MSIISNLRADYENLTYSLNMDNGFDLAEVRSNTPEPLAWIQQYFHGYYTLSEHSDSSYRISSIQDAELVESVRNELRTASPANRGKTYQKQFADVYELSDGLAYRYLERDAVLIIPHNKEEAFFVTSPHDPESRFEASRHLREYYSRMLERRGYVILHAGVVAKDDKAIIFVGPKGSGKSTSMTAMLEWPGTDFIANDRAYAGFTNGTFEMVAWATTAKIGLGTAYASAPLRPWLNPTASFSYPQEESTSQEREFYLRTATEDQRWLAKQKIELTPAEITHTFNTRINARADLALIAFPKVAQTTGEGWVFADPQHAEDILNDQCFTPDDDSYTDWLGLRVARPETIRENRAGLIKNMIAAIPSIEVTYTTAAGLRQAVNACLKDKVPEA